MFIRTTTVAAAMAVFTALPFVGADAQVTQQQQQQQQQQRGTLATVNLTADLSAADVVADTTAMTLSPTAKASFSLIQATKELCYEVNFQDMPDSTIASIHRGAKGENGPSVLSLDIRKDTVMTKNCVKVEDMVFNDLVANPANFYVQINNPKWRKGAIRGQLAKPPQLF